MSDSKKITCYVEYYAAMDRMKKIAGDMVDEFRRTPEGKEYFELFDAMNAFTSAQIGAELDAVLAKAREIDKRKGTTVAPVTTIFDFNTKIPGGKN